MASSTYDSVTVRDVLRFSFKISYIVKRNSARFRSRNFTPTFAVQREGWVHRERKAPLESKGLSLFQLLKVYVSFFSISS